MRESRDMEKLVDQPGSVAPDAFTLEVKDGCAIKINLGEARIQFYLYATIRHSEND